MSRLGKLPVEIPQGVKASVDGSLLKVEGPKGKLNYNIPAGVTISLDGTKLVSKRRDDSAEQKAKHGLVRSLMANMVKGVSQGFERRLEIKGVGYRAAVKGKELNLVLGYSHPVNFPLPDTIVAKVEANTQIILQCPDKALLGDVAAKIRALRPPEPYQGKGIKYSDEVIRRKAGKAAASSK
ncbi:MAG: 50S ribosomal protein L6 [Proteobacteria bacterium]|jgi:large subunit ribosomal protein L6|nr:50S ribosomal protein L6 [Pseudomonadota bacterium]